MSNTRHPHLLEVKFHRISNQGTSSITYGYSPPQPDVNPSLVSLCGQAEKEVFALEATLGKLAEKNGQFRASFRSAESEAMAAEKDAARAALDRAYDKLKLKRSQEQLLAAEVEQHEQRRANIAAEQVRPAGMGGGNADC